MLRGLFAFHAVMYRPVAVLYFVATILLPGVGFAQSKVAGGTSFTMVVKSDGTLWAFGCTKHVIPAAVLKLIGGLSSPSV